MTNEQLVLRVQSKENESENMLQLWKQNKGFVYLIAKKYNFGAEQEDLEQEGYIALCEAVENYDIERGKNFISYYAFYLHKHYRECVKNNRLIKIPEWMNDEVRRYKVFFREYKKKCGFEPSDSEIMAFLNVGYKEYINIKDAVQKGQITSLNDTLGVRFEELTLEETLASDVSLEDDITERLDMERMKRDVWIAVDRLTLQQREVIKLRFKKDRTIRDTGNELGLTEASVRSLEKIALRKLSLEKYSGNLKHYHEEYVGSTDVKYGSVGAFKRTWTSTTEEQAFKNMGVRLRDNMA